LRVALFIALQGAPTNAQSLTRYQNSKSTSQAIKHNKQVQEFISLPVCVLNHKAKILDTKCNS